MRDYIQIVEILIYYCYERNSLFSPPYSARYPIYPTHWPANLTFKIVVTNEYACTNLLLQSNNTAIP